MFRSRVTLTFSHCSGNFRNKESLPCIWKSTCKSEFASIASVCLSISARSRRRACCCSRSCFSRSSICFSLISNSASPVVGARECLVTFLNFINFQITGMGSTCTEISLNNFLNDRSLITSHRCHQILCYVRLPNNK